MKLCMFTPRELQLERGWPGVVEGDTVIQLAAQTLQSFFTGGGAARRHAEDDLADLDFRPAGAAPAVGAGLLRFRAARQDGACVSRPRRAGRVVRDPRLLLLEPRGDLRPARRDPQAA